MLPDTLLRKLAWLPAARPLAVLLRHAARPPLLVGETGDALALTEEGVTASRQLGQELGPRLVALHSSPILRCVQTAEALREGAGVTRDIHPDRMLGAPGAFIIDDVLGGQTLQGLGLDGFIEHLTQGEGALPGIAEPIAAAFALVWHLIERTGSTPGVHVFVTHDSLLAPAVARFLSCPLPRCDWPRYLESALFWREEGIIRGAYRGYESCVRATTGSAGSAG